MIELTKMNGEPIVVNAARIETVEGRLDTSVVLQSGTRFVVRETPLEIVALVRAFHKDIAVAALAELQGNTVAGIIQESQNGNSYEESGEE
jgi:flagellar protein FlbD